MLGTWVEIFCAIGALWAALVSVGEHLPFAVVAMGYLIGQLAQVIPVPGGIGAIDAGVVGALVLYGANVDHATAGELIAHALALLLPLIAGSVAFALLPREIRRTQQHTGIRGAASSQRPIELEGSEDDRPSMAATVGVSVGCDDSDSFALTRVFSGLLARVNNRMFTPRPMPRFRASTIWPFAGVLEWALKDSDLPAYGVFYEPRGT